MLTYGTGKRRDGQQDTKRISTLYEHYKEQYQLLDGFKNMRSAFKSKIEKKLFKKVIGKKIPIRSYFLGYLY